jgi:hypothetical protein
VTGCSKLSFDYQKMIAERLRLLQERCSDPPLAALTVMLEILLFVVGPLQAA